MAIKDAAPRLTTRQDNNNNYNNNDHNDNNNDHNDNNDDHNDNNNNNDHNDNNNDHNHNNNNNDRMWTRLEDFPKGFGHLELALEADIFEASHTYRLKGLGKYLTIVEANPGGKRYYKAYLADKLDGKWTPLADSEKNPFAGAANVRPAKGVEPWADNISHGELIRDSNDERMIVDPSNLRFLIQGATEKEESAASGYGRIPWRIGMLTSAK